MSNNNLPVVQKRNLPDTIKKGLSKTAKVLGYGSLTGLTSIAFVLSCSMAPILILPSAAGLFYSTQKFLNETKYKSHKDIGFVTGKHKGNVKIYQDIARPDITSKLLGMSEIEKAGFIQLQAIIGISKLDQLDKHGNPIQFETDSHSVVQKTFQKLQAVGLLQNYSEEPKTQFFNKKKQMHSHLLLPKLAFGNLKGIKSKTPIYNIKFQLSDKKVDINDPDLQRAFPMVFSKRKGLLAKYNYDIIQNPDGTLSIDYHANSPFIQRNTPNKGNTSFRESLKDNTPSLQEQKEFSDKFQTMEIESRNNQEAEQTIE